MDSIRWTADSVMFRNSSSWKRRECTSVWVSGWVWLAVTITQLDANEWERHQRSATFMGTKWHIALYSQDSDAANRAFKRAWAVIDEIDQDLSNYRLDSELNRLCRSAPHAEPVPVGKHVWSVMRAADELSRHTGGAFDVTIGPLTRLWRRARLRKRLPDPDRLRVAQQSVGFELVHYDLEHQAIQLTRPGMRLDLGGIAKGYAVDQAREAARKQGIDRILVNGGGDLVVGAAPPQEPGWRVAIASLDPQAPSEYLTLTHAAVATSGDAWQFLEIDGKRYSHIVDPRTGMGTTGRSSVSVLAPTCMQADGWASALSVLDVDQGLRLVAEVDGLEAMLITVGGNGQATKHASSGFAPRQ